MAPSVVAVQETATLASISKGGSYLIRRAAHLDSSDGSLFFLYAFSLVQVNPELETLLTDVFHVIHSFKTTTVTRSTYNN